MNIERIKFAWARGARIQTAEFDGQTGVWTWRTCSVKVLEHWGNRRIHPDDEHLAYGPLSSALIKRVTTLFEEGDADWAWVAAWATLRAIEEHQSYGTDTTADNAGRLGMLFAAELLADEGL